jgi:hypothetical protein
MHDLGRKSGWRADAQVLVASAVGRAVVGFWRWFPKYQGSLLSLICWAEANLEVQIPVYKVMTTGLKLW